MASRTKKEATGAAAAVAAGAQPAGQHDPEASAVGTSVANGDTAPQRRMHEITERTEMHEAVLNLGGTPIRLRDYAKTGFQAVAVGPKGSGKTNAAQLIAEQLSEQGWVSVLIDPEGQLGGQYRNVASGPEQLRQWLTTREHRIVVVMAADATEFVPYGQVLLEVADELRQPILVVVDEGQLFSSARKRTEGIGEASDIVSDISARGRKRGLDLMITAHRMSGTLHRTIFTNNDLVLLGRQSDTSGIGPVQPRLASAGVRFTDLESLRTGEFFCLARHGIERVMMPMAAALGKVTSAAVEVKPLQPRNFNQWDEAMRELSLQALQALTPAVTSFLGALAGLTPAQMLAGKQALADELETR